MIHDHFTDHEALLKFLRHQYEIGNSGTLYITTDQNHSARFVINNGNIVSMSFRSKKGMQALPGLTAIESAKYSFSADSLTMNSDEYLPATEQLLEMLHMPEPDKAQGKANQGQSVRAQIERRSIATILTRIEDEYAMELGPIASLLIDDYINSQGAPEDKHGALLMVDSLSSEIDDIEKARKFRQRVNSLF
ncbi:MAG: hypothetical protein ABW116_11350 [Candidatus Sedimenticola sp. 20ELBAFRAG]